MKVAYLIQGLSSCGKTTFANEQAAKNNGAVLHADDFFYKVHQPDKPTEYSYSQAKLPNMMRWWWVSLKALANAGATPLYLDQNNLFVPHTWKTAAFLMERYDYDVQILHPENVWWTQVRELLQDKETNARALEEWSVKLTANNRQGTTQESVQKAMAAYKEYTMDDIIEQF